MPKPRKKVCGNCDRVIKDDRYVRSGFTGAYYHFPGDCSAKGEQERKRKRVGFERAF